MLMFKVEGMTCAHCERAVTNAIHRIDPDARVDIDLAAGTVRTDSQARTDQLADAIRSEGYEASVSASHG
ncbi:heavy-metal-associated domain-containing protein [Rhodopila sp.]|uniref:heavy-metal-associated domain-containing protein n=1 Tax=Rhodopila sp. TaxID=2480087 RepID=UPI003D0C38F3